MGIPAGELRERMTPLEFSLHFALEAEEPHDWPANRVLFGNLQTLIANVNGGRRGGGTFRGPDDWYPPPARRVEPAQTLEQQKAIFGAIFGSPQ